MSGFLIPESPDEEFAANADKLRACGLPAPAANGYMPPEVRCVGDDADFDRCVRYGETAFRRAKSVGVETVVFGSGGSRRLPEGFSKARAFDQFVALLKALGPIAGRNDVTIVIEPLNAPEDNGFINSLGDGAAAVEACGHPNVQLLADIYHMLVQDQPPTDIERYGRMLHHVHVAELEGRRAPGTAGEDFGSYLRALKRAGYDKRISIECGYEDFDAEIGPTAAYMRDQLAKVGF